MGLQKTNGIVLNQFKYSETSLIVNILTEEYGKMSFIVNGVRKKKSKFPANYFQSFNLLQIVFIESKKSDLHKITEISNQIVLTDIIFNIQKTSICMFLAEIINITSQKLEKDDKLYQFLEQIIQYIDSAKNEEISNIHLWSMLRLMQFNGISPNNNFSEQNKFFNPVEGSFSYETLKNKYIYSEENSKIIHQLLGSSIDTSSKIKINKNSRLELLELMTQYFQLHIDGFKASKSLSILSEIFA